METNTKLSIDGKEIKTEWIDIENFDEHMGDMFPEEAFEVAEISEWNRNGTIYYTWSGKDENGRLWVLEQINFREN